MSSINDLHILSKIKYIHELLECYDNPEAAAHELESLYEDIRGDIYD